MLNTVNINIQRSSDHGQWFARTESDAKTGETNVIFFQREGIKGTLQNLNSSSNVCKGQEISSEYLSALGLKSTNINNEDLNAVFQAGYKQMQAHIPFGENEVLVSKFDEENNPKIQIKINDTLIESAEHQNAKAMYEEVKIFEDSIEACFKVTKSRTLPPLAEKISKALMLAVNIRNKAHFSLSPIPLINASRALNEFRTLVEKNSEITHDQRQVFFPKIDSLSKVLDEQYNKFNAQSEKHKTKFIERTVSSKVKANSNYDANGKMILTEVQKKEMKDNLSIIFSESVRRDEKTLKDRPEDRKRLKAAVEWLDDLIEEDAEYELEINNTHKSDLKEKLELCEDLLRQSEPG